MAEMGKVLGAVISITVSIIVIGSVLAPSIAQYTGSGQALESYAAIVGSITIITIVAVMMIAVRLINKD